MKVSILMPVYNPGPYLLEAIESALKQSYHPFELIIVDDGSTEDIDALSKVQHHPCIKIQRTTHQGVSHARNCALKLATGDKITFLDSDDKLHPKKLEEQVARNADVILSDVLTIDAKGNPLTYLQTPTMEQENILPNLLFRQCFANDNVMMIRKEKMLPFDTQLPYGEMYDLLLRLAQENATFDLVAKPLTEWRRHQHNLTNTARTPGELEKRIHRKWTEEQIIEAVDTTTYTPEEKQLLAGKIFLIRQQLENALSYLLPLSSEKAAFYRGNCYFLQNAWELALKEYHLAENLPYALNNLGCVYRILGEEEHAMSAFEKALSLQPDYMDPKKNLNKEPLAFTLRELRPSLVPYMV